MSDIAQDLNPLEDNTTTGRRLALLISRTDFPVRLGVLSETDVWVIERDDLGGNIVSVRSPFAGLPEIVRISVRHNDIRWGVVLLRALAILNNMGALPVRYAQRLNAGRLFPVRLPGHAEEEVAELTPVRFPDDDNIDRLEALNERTRAGGRVDED